MDTYASEVVSRALLGAMMGLQYGGSRDLYQALGYPTELKYEDFASRYYRQDMAKAVIDKPIEATWRGQFRITESTEEEVTPLEEAWDDLAYELGIKSKFRRLDKLAGLGEYAVLFLGFDDTTGELTAPVTRANRLLYVKPFGENHAEVNEWDNDVKSPRYGQPVIYNLTITNYDGTASGTLKVHYSRILHVAGDILESECEGSPTLKVLFNRLIDLDKVVGSSAEMFWRGGRPGYHGNVQADRVLSDTAETDLKSKLDEYDHNLRRFLLTEGIDIKALETQVADPSKTFDVIVQSISAVTGIPKRILIGSERGELASSEDRNSWLDTITTRREEYAEAQIVRPFVDRLIKLGVLPEPKEKYKVEWEDLYASTEKEKADIGRSRSESIRNYSTSPTAEDIFPVEAFYKYILNLNDEEIRKILEIREEQMSEEERLMGRAEEKFLMEEEARMKEEKRKEALANPEPASKKPA